MFISCSSLWANLEVHNVEKTRTYIQRSKPSPLDVFIDRDFVDDTYVNDTFLPVIPHIYRFKSLPVYGKFPPTALGRFYHHAPLLEELDIHLTDIPAPVLSSELFNSNLSSLRKLTLGRVVTHLPWHNLANLTIFKLTSCPPGRNFVIQLLSFFQCAPPLRTVTLEDSIPTTSDAPPGRIVSLPRLKNLTITAEAGHNALLNHLCIPTRASLTLRLNPDGMKRPLRDHLSETLVNLKNLPHITTIHLLLDNIWKHARLSGPGGRLNVFIRWRNEYPLGHMDSQILHSLSPPTLSTTQRLAISRHEPLEPARVEKSSVFRTLSHMNKLHTLTLTKRHNLPYFLALNPKKKASKRVLCPDLGRLILYIKSQNQFCIEHLLAMAKERALRGAKLASVTIVGLGGLAPAEGVFGLREHVAHVDYRAGGSPPVWDHLDDENE